MTRWCFILLFGLALGCTGSTEAVKNGDPVDKPSVAMPGDSSGPKKTKDESKDNAQGQMM